jgi:crossover junction endonuclease MUS81
VSPLSPLPLFCTDVTRTDAEYGKAIWTCKSQLQINDGFYVHESSNIADTIKYLRQRTLVMIELYEVRPPSAFLPHPADPQVQNKDLHLIPDVHIDRPSYLPLQKHLRATSPSTTFLTTYTSFCNLNRTDAALSLRTQWATMIQMNSGVSAEKAVQFIRRWPTPRSFWDGTRDHRRIVEKELEEAGPGGEGKGKKKARKAEDYISECFEGDTLSRGLKGKLATKLFHLFASVDYED